jgi:hypothetical protein
MPTPIARRCARPRLPLVDESHVSQQAESRNDIRRHEARDWGNRIHGSGVADDMLPRSLSCLPSFRKAVGLSNIQSRQTR